MFYSNWLIVPRCTKHLVKIYYVFDLTGIINTPCIASNQPTERISTRVPWNHLLTDNLFTTFRDTHSGDKWYRGTANNKSLEIDIIWPYLGIHFIHKRKRFIVNTNFWSTLTIHLSKKSSIEQRFPNCGTWEISRDTTHFH